MLNHRGNRYSLGHKLRNQGKIDTFKYRWSGKYWQFSFWEMAVYDHPAIIDYILEETGAEQLHYAGYSMGTMTLLAGMDFYSYLNHQDSRAELTEDVREKLMPFKQLDGYDMQGKIASAHLIGSVWNCAGFINPLKEKNSKFYRQNSSLNTCNFAIREITKLTSTACIIYFRGIPVGLRKSLSPTH